MENLRIYEKKAQIPLYKAVVWSDDDEHEFYLYSEMQKENFIENIENKFRYEITDYHQDNAWINGMEFTSLQDVYNTIEMGEAAYFRKINFDAMEKTEQLEETITDLQLAIVELYEGG